MIVEATGKIAAVFDTAATNSATTAPLYTLAMDLAALPLPGSAGAATAALPLFAGPPCRTLPVPEVAMAAEE